MNDAGGISGDILKENLKLNMYMRRTYQSECHDIINTKNINNQRNTEFFLLILILVYTLTCFLYMYSLSGYIFNKEDIEGLSLLFEIISYCVKKIFKRESLNIKKTLAKIGEIYEHMDDYNSEIFGINLSYTQWINIKHIFFKILYILTGILAILVIFGAYMIKRIVDYVDGFEYLMKTYEFVVSVVYNKADIPLIRTIDCVNKIELFIDKFMYINVPHEITNTPEDFICIREFDALLCSGDIDGARNYALNNSSNEKIRSFLLKSLNDDDNILFNNIGMSFTPTCNSFYLNKLNKYISLKSSKGRKVLLSGSSGSGKSTITNALFADSRLFPSFINDQPAYLIASESKKILPYYSEKYIPIFDKLNIIDNFMLADSNVQNNELSYIFKKLDISKYYNSLENIFSMVAFSHGQSSRILLSRVFISLNGIIKKSMDSITDQEVINEINKAFITDGEDVDFELIRKHLKLKSFMVILDEPLSALDKISANKVMQCVNKYSELGFTFIIIDHCGLVGDYADDMIQVNNKTCEYYTKINKEFQNIEDLKDNFVVLDNGYAFETSYKAPSSVGQLISDYRDGKISETSILDSIELDESIKKFDNISLNQTADTIESNTNPDVDKIDKIVMLNQDNVDKIDRIVILNDQQDINSNTELIPILIKS